MCIDAIPAELLLRIAEYLPDKDKFHLLICNKNLYHYRQLLRFQGPAFLSKIIDSDLIFLKITVDVNKKIPFGVKCLTFRHNLDVELQEVPMSDVFLYSPNTSSIQFLFANAVTRHGPEIIIPESVTHLKFVQYFNQFLSSIRIPTSVTHMTFGQYFNQPLDNIPNSVTHLTLGSSFNQPLENSIPASVQHLTFGYWFNQPLGMSLPTSLTHLIFGCHFNQPLGSNIPASVIHLEFGYFFNQPLEGCIPIGLEYLAFGYGFRQPLGTSIPLTIKELHLYSGYQHDVSRYAHAIRRCS